MELSYVLGSLGLRWLHYTGAVTASVIKPMLPTVLGEFVSSCSSDNMLLTA